MKQSEPVDWERGRHAYPDYLSACVFLEVYAPWISSLKREFEIGSVFGGKSATVFDAGPCVIEARACPWSRGIE